MNFAEWMCVLACFQCFPVSLLFLLLGICFLLFTIFSTKSRSVIKEVIISVIIIIVMVIVNSIFSIKTIQIACQNLISRHHDVIIGQHIWIAAAAVTIVRVDLERVTREL